MRVVATAQMGISNASTRYRLLRHVEGLRSRLQAVQVILPSEDVPPPTSLASRALFGVRHARRYVSHRRRLADVLAEADAILVQRGVYPLGPAWVAAPVCNFRGRVVLDLDDAIFETSPGLATKGRLARWAYSDSQARALAARADAIVVSSEILADGMARTFGRRPEIVLPTWLDPTVYVQATHKTRSVVRIGWAGNAGNLGCLDPLHELIGRLRKEHLAELEVVCSAPWVGPASFRRWCLQEEPRMFARFDIGIMPLPDTPYTRAKAGFKLLQYLAAGIPIVASPVGANVEIVGRSGAGYLASDEQEWDKALRCLIESASLRAKLGARGRRWLEAHADQERDTDLLAALLTE